MSHVPTVSINQRTKRGQIRPLLERRAGIEEMAGMDVRNPNRRDFHDGNLQVEENKTLRLEAQVEENPVKGQKIRRQEEEQT
jgi:chromosome condensin MukBEF MukE localization factor